MKRISSNKHAYVVVFFAAVTLLLWQTLFKNRHDYENLNIKVPNLILNDFVSEKNVELKSLQGKPYILHFWATWCGVCIKEHNDWLEFAQNADLPIVGVNFHDQPKQAKQFLQRKGNPYQYSISDAEGAFGVQLGLKGTPETFVVNANGKIIYRHTGPVSGKVLNQEILPLL